MHSVQTAADDQESTAEAQCKEYDSAAIVACVC